MLRRETLLLNQGYQIIKPISWKRAICLHFLGKVDILEEYSDKVSSPSIKLSLPAVVRLRHQTKVEPMKVRFSRAAVYSRDNRTCQYCNKQFKVQDLTLDHVIPKSVGGKTSWTNIVSCCQGCNTLKANRTPQQANMKLIKRPAYPTTKSIFSANIDGSIPAEWQNWLSD